MARAERDLVADPGGHLLGGPGADGLLDVVGVLARDQPEGELHHGRGRDDRLAAGALVAAADAVDLGGGAGPDALQGGVSGLAVGGVRLGGAQPLLLVEGQFGEEFALAVGEFDDAVVEAGDRHARVLVVQGGDQAGGGGGRVGHGAAEGAGVDVLVGAVQPISHSARPRMPVHTVGVSSDHMPVSETITASAASRSACCSTRARPEGMMSFAESERRPRRRAPSLCRARPRSEDDCRHRRGERGGRYAWRGVRGHRPPLPAGLGSYVQWDRKLDGRLAQAMMCIHAIKGSAVLARTALRPGLARPRRILPPAAVVSPAADQQCRWPRGRRDQRPGHSCHGFMKPIATLMKPLRSVDLDHAAPKRRGDRAQRRLRRAGRGGRRRSDGGVRAR